MKILTLGDSWTYGTESSDPATMSWPAQMSKKYNVEVVNLARAGSSNQRAVRIGVEELSRNSNYDWVILPLAPASRTEVLNKGKWHQVWPNAGTTVLDKIYTDFWHPWNDLQMTMHLCIHFLSFVNLVGPKLLITGLSMQPAKYQEELSWIVDYKNDCNFRSLGMPLDEFNIGTTDLDRKLKSLKSMHDLIMQHQPEYLYDVVEHYLNTSEVRKNYGKVRRLPMSHPNDQGYEALADYFASKIKI